MGLANRITSKLATKVFYSFPNPEIQDGKKHIYTGHIMNPLMLDELSANAIIENEYLHVLVIAGSQGSQKIFESMMEIIPLFPDIEFRII